MAGRSPEEGREAVSASSRPERAPGEIRRRGWAEVRWRQFRRAPRPVVRAVLSPLLVAVVLGIAYLAYDLALLSGAQLPGGDLRFAALVGYVVAVLVVGTLVTWLVVPLPTGAGTRAVRSPWSAALGFFASLPIAYLVMVVLLELVRPFLR